MSDHLNITKVSPDTLGDLVGFLKRHEDYTLFLQSNLETFGPNLTSAPYSGNYYLVSESNRVRAAFSLTRSGTVLLHSEVGEQPFPPILKTCLAEEPIIQGVIGEWSLAYSFWNLLKAEGHIAHDTLTEREVLFTQSTSTLPQAEVPSGVHVRLLEPHDYPEWSLLHHPYIAEMHLPNPFSDAELNQDFLRKVAAKISWGLFVKGKLVTIAELNARAGTLGQVGGVFTLPEYRGNGLAKALMRQLINDAWNLHRIYKLIIFTGEHNYPAQRVYVSLGAIPVGHYALLFGEPAQN